MTRQNGSPPGKETISTGMAKTDFSTTIHTQDNAQANIKNVQLKAKASSEQKLTFDGKARKHSPYVQPKTAQKNESEIKDLRPKGLEHHNSASHLHQKYNSSHTLSNLNGFDLFHRRKNQSEGVTAKSDNLQGKTKLLNSASKQNPIAESQKIHDPKGNSAVLSRQKIATLAEKRTAKKAEELYQKEETHKKQQEKSPKSNENNIIGEAKMEVTHKKSNDNAKHEEKQDNDEGKVAENNDENGKAKRDKSEATDQLAIEKEAEDAKREEKQRVQEEQLKDETEAKVVGEEGKVEKGKLLSKKNEDKNKGGKKVEKKDIKFSGRLETQDHQPETNEGTKKEKFEKTEKNEKGKSTNNEAFEHAPKKFSTKAQKTIIDDPANEKKNKDDIESDKKDVKNSKAEHNNVEQDKNLDAENPEQLGLENQNDEIGKDEIKQMDGQEKKGKVKTVKATGETKNFEQIISAQKEKTQKDGKKEEEKEKEKEKEEEGKTKEGKEVEKEKN